MQESQNSVRKEGTVFFIYVLKNKSCLNLLKISILHLEQVCVKSLFTFILFLKRNNDFNNLVFLKCSQNDQKWHILSKLFEQENVFAVVTRDELKISYVIPHDKTIMWTSLLAMAADKVSYLEYYVCEAYSFA